jgi:hypothetical protein
MSVTESQSAAVIGPSNNPCPLDDVSSVLARRERLLLPGVKYDEI